MTPFWATAKANKTNQVDLDDAAIKNYWQSIQSGTDQTVALQTSMVKASQSARDFAAAGNLTTESIDAFKNSQVAAIKQTGFFKSALVSLKAIGASLGAMFVNMAVMFAVTEVINGVIKLVDYLVVTSDEAQQAASDMIIKWNEAADTLSSHKKTLDGIKTEYVSLSNGVSSFGEQVSLTDDEFERYHEITNQIADMFPTLVSGWDDQGNAILSTRGSVEDLTNAYEDLVIQQKEAILAGASTVFSGYTANAKNDSKWAWGGDVGYIPQTDYIETVMSMIESGKTNAAAEYAMDNVKIAKAVGEGLKEAGFDDVAGMDNTEYLKALTTYRNILVKEADADVKEFQRIADAYLYLSDEYTNLEDSTKKGISSILGSFDLDFISQFSDEKELYAWIENSLLDPLKSIDFSNILDIKSLFDTNEISVGTYQKYYSDFLNSIKGLAPEVQAALTESFSPDVDNLIANVQEKLLDEYDDQVYTLTLDQLKIAADLDIADTSWEELQSSINTTSALSAQSITDLTTELTSLIDVYELISTAIGEQNTNGYVSVETYQALIAANQDYANSFENVNGQLQLNADSAYNLADAMSAVDLAEAEAGKDANRAAFDKNIEQIKLYNEQLDLLRGKEDSDDYYKSIEDQRDALIDTNEELENQYQQYEAIASQIRAMTGAYAKYLAAQKTANSGDVYESMSGASDALKESVKSGKIVNDDTQSAVDYILGGDSASESYEEQMRRAKEAQKKYARYFTEDNKGVANFGADLIKNGLAKNVNGYTTLGEGVTGQDLMEELGLSQDAVIAILKDLEEYGGQFDWSKLFPEMTPEEIEQTEEPASVIDEAAQQLVKDAGGYGDSADEAVKLITDANQAIADALAGKTPNYENPSSTGESGGVSLFTAGQSNESSTPTPSSVTPTTQVVQQTVYVNVETGNALDPAEILIGVTRNEDGTLSYDVKANAAANTILSENELIASLNDDGSYDVSVNGIIGDKVNGDALVIGVNPFDGQYYVKTNGSISEKIDAANLVIGLNPFDGQLYVKTNGTVGEQIEPEDLLPGIVTTDNGDLVYEIGISAAKAEESLDELSNKAEEPIVMTIDVPKQTVDNTLSELPLADNTYNIPEAQNAGDKLLREREIKIDVYTDLLNEDETQETLSSFADKTILVPFDADPATAQTSINTFEGTLETIIIPVDSDTDEAYQQALDLKADIEKMVPTMRVIVKPGAPTYAEGSRRITKKQVAIVDDGNGAEAIIRPDGTAEIGTDNGPRPVILNPNDKVLTAEETKKMLARSGGTKLSMFASGSAGSWPTIPTSASTSTAAKSKSVSWQKYFENLFDWIEIKLDRLSRITDNWTKQIQRAVGLISKNSTVDEALKSIEDQISAYETASAKYMAQANSVAKKSGLSKSIVGKIQNGTLDISAYSESTQEKISEYQKWYDKVLETQDAIIDLEDQQKELANQKIDNISDAYSNLTEVIENTSSATQSALDLLVAQGKEIKSSNYATLIDDQTKKVALLRQEQNALLKEFNAQVNSGSLTKGSDAWYEYQSLIKQLDSEILNAQTDLIDLNDTVNDLTITKLGYQLSELSEQEAVIQRQLDLIDAQGGTATDSLYEKLIDIGFDQIEILNAQNAALNDQLAGLDPLSEKYQEIADQIRSNNDAISETVNSQEQWNDTILDLKIAEIEKAKDALSEANDEYQRQKDLQQAIEDLERAKSQRQVRILENGTFKYVADQESIANAQQNLDEKLHDETMAKFDKAIELLEDSKSTDNVYASAGLAPTSIQDLFNGLAVEDIIASVLGSNVAGSSITESLSKIGAIASTTSVTNGDSITIAPGAINIQISTPSTDPEAIFNVLDSRMSNAVQQALHR